MNWAKFALAASAILLNGCQPGSSGPLEPVPAPGIAIHADNDGRPFVRVSGPALMADISGTWTSVRGQDFVVAYTNNGPEDLTIPFPYFALRRDGDRLALSAIVDTTRFGQPGEFEQPIPPPLFNSDTTPMARSLTIPAAQMRRIELSFDDPPEDVPVDEGQILTLLTTFSGIRKTIHFTAG